VPTTIPTCLTPRPRENTCPKLQKSTMDLDPQTHQENVCTDVATVSLPSGPGESSQARNPPVESTHVEDVDDDSESES
jgi:hypothetical protein